MEPMSLKVSTMYQRAIWVFMSTFSLLLASAASAPAQQPNDRDDWLEQYAYTLGVQAYIYGFPYVYMTELRWFQVAATGVPSNLPHMAVNHFWNNQVMGEPESQAGGSPNNDTLYSIAW